MKKFHSIILCLAIMMAGIVNLQAQKTDPAIEGKVKQYATVPLKYDVGQLEPDEQELMALFIQIADVMDDIYWEQTVGMAERNKLRRTADRNIVEFANINYGPWDRLDGNKPFVPGYGPRPAGLNFYPKDMKKSEFDALKDPLKTSPYTIVRRNSKGQLEVVPYHKAYERQLRRAEEMLKQAIGICKNEELRHYLETRLTALTTDEYEKSDLIWMDMKKSRLDFVFGPIETYDDALYGYKTAYEAFVLVKDEEWSNRLAHFSQMLPDMQKSLPCDPKYKQEKPGTESDINVYDVVYYAGQCNAGGKTIAINLPNDEKVQFQKGTRRLQLKNVMQAKFDEILRPIANTLIVKDQLKNVTFDAFFNNVCFHEVAHGLGVKNVVGGKETVREALKNQYSAWEEAKADICGLFMVQNLIEKGEIKGVSVEDAYITYMAGLLRSVRFGATEAHGIANIMCFNYMKKQGAFLRTEDGHYMVDVKKMRKAIEGWAKMVLETEGAGNYENAKSYASKNGVVQPELQKDLQKLSSKNIPVDIRFEQGIKQLGLDGMIMREQGPAKVNDDKHLRLRP